MTGNDNKQLVHRLVEIVNDRDLDSIDEVAGGPIAAEARGWIGPFRESFPDFRMEVVDVIAEGDMGRARLLPPGARARRGRSELPAGGPRR